MEEQLIQLSATPSDWGLRCSIAQEYYEGGKLEAAASLITSAPEIPGDENSTLFAATIIGATDPAAGQQMLDEFIKANGSTEGIEALKQQLGEFAGAEGPEIPAITCSAPVVPKKLRPPGEEGEEKESAPATPAPSLEASTTHVQEVHENVKVLDDEIPVEGHEDEHFHTLVAEDHEHHERAFIVGEGEAVHAAERAPDTNEKLGAVLIAAIIHVIVIIGLMFWAMADPPPPPPTIAVSSAADDGDASLENQTMTKMKQKTASAVATSQPIISSTAFSSFAIPETFDADTNLTMVSMSDSDAGFGMSMSGFGDVSNMGAIPAGMRSRCSMSQRMKRLRESGGEDRAERAVREGLEFLTKKQNKEGAIAGSFGEEYHAGMTGLALLAYLGHCETPESPKFGDSVVSAALFLMDRCLKNDGKITNGQRGHHEAYEHAIGTYALSELYTMTKESGKEIPRLESVLKKAVGVIVDAQSKDGGWPYGFEAKGKDDMSVSGWQIQALKAAYNTGRKFSGVEKALDKATEKYLPAIQDSEGAFKYNPDHAKGKPTLTGAALLGMQIWKGMGTPTYEKGFKYLTAKYKNPSPGSNYYAPYYNTQVFFMAEGQEWEDYNKKFQPQLLDAQNEDGSWLKDGGTRKDNQIMNTAWAILMLEVYYRYLPTTDKVKDLEVR